MLTHSQAKEVFDALTKEGDSNVVLAHQWALFRLALEMGGDHLYSEITGKPVTAPEDPSKPAVSKLATAAPVIPTVPVSTNPSLPSKTPG